jgi:hypothetical protein
VSKVWRTAAGAALAALGLFGVVHAARASAAQALYHRARHGAASGDLPRGLRLAERAYRFYPYHYYLCIWACRSAYEAAAAAGASDAEGWRAAAGRWCERGLALNPYKRQLRLIRARIIARASPADAARYWEEYLSWHFWDQENHVAMVEFYAKAGRLHEAMEQLKWLKGADAEARARAALRRVWQAEMDMGGTNGVAAGDAGLIPDAPRPQENSIR